MKLPPMLLGLSLAIWMAMAIGTVLADDGAGVCVIGIGTDLQNVGAPAYVGVTISDPSAAPDAAKWAPQTWTNATGFETECCAESGQAPDCFRPVH